MTVIRHGLSIGIERVDDRFFLTLKAVGKLTHADYQRINPLIDSALEGVAEPCIRAFIDASELDGWELRAVWDDFRLGLRHGSQFERIAIVGNRRWQALAARVASWFVSGEVRHFEAAAAAFDWLGE